jgi:urease accessory protein
MTMTDSMLELFERAGAEEHASSELVLPFDTRQKSRFRAQLKDGRDALVKLERGQMLRNGDKLRAASGEVVAVRAEKETVSVARTADAQLHARGAYHLGNRHVPLEIRPGELIYQHDHVLDDMLQKLGLGVEVEERPFEPESGAYGSGHAHHSHPGHGHGHSHAHIHHAHGDESDGEEAHHSHPHDAGHHDAAPHHHKASHHDHSEEDSES